MWWHPVAREFHENSPPWHANLQHKWDLKNAHKWSHESQINDTKVQAFRVTPQLDSHSRFREPSNVTLVLPLTTLNGDFSSPGLGSIKSSLCYANVGLSLSFTPELSIRVVLFLVAATLWEMRTNMPWRFRMRKDLGSRYRVGGRFILLAPTKHE